MSRLVLKVFRLNGALLEAGDTLVRDTGLTSARWQVLGALAEHGAPRTVSQIARAMGLTRQSVQRVTDDLHDSGLVEFLPNP
ncbi:MAG TPA: helix-turn-helix domain-containing protein, partial [Alphaproteobacteria bacterium]|nr:helix-turn-helix domain-containing protein [Alphaproteobacteria bacterium]